MIAQFRRLVAGLLILTLAAAVPGPRGALVTDTPRSTTSASPACSSAPTCRQQLRALRRRSRPRPARARPR